MQTTAYLHGKRFDMVDFDGLCCQHSVSLLFAVLVLFQQFSLFIIVVFLTHGACSTSDKSNGVFCKRITQHCGYSQRSLRFGLHTSNKVALGKERLLFSLRGTASSDVTLFSKAKGWMKAIENHVSLLVPVLFNLSSK